MSSSPLERGFNTRDWPVKTGHSEVIEFDGLSPSRTIETEKIPSFGFVARCRELQDVPPEGAPT